MPPYGRPRDEPPPALQHAHAREAEFVTADPRFRRHVPAEHHRRGRQDHPPARELRIDASELKGMYERAYLDDRRAQRNDSVDVYARAGDYIDRVISQIERLQRACATPSRRAARRATGRDHSSLGRFDEDQLAAAGCASSGPRQARASRPHGPGGTRCSRGPRETRVSGARSPPRDTTPVGAHPSRVRLTVTRRQAPRAGHRRRAHIGGTPRRTDGSAHGDARDARTRRRRRDTRSGMPQAPCAACPRQGRSGD
jgi:hypothetical protein